MSDQPTLYLWDQDKADRRLVVKLTDSALLELGVLVPVELTDRICTWHKRTAPVDADLCLEGQAGYANCVMADVVRVYPNE